MQDTALRIGFEDSFLGLFTLTKITKRHTDKELLVIEMSVYVVIFSFDCS